MALEICEEGHTVIVHDRSRCPMCELIHEVEEDKEAAREHVESAHNDLILLADTITAKVEATMQAYGAVGDATQEYKRLVEHQPIFNANWVRSIAEDIKSAAGDIDAIDLS